MKLQHKSNSRKSRRSKKPKGVKVQKCEESLIEFTEWLGRISMPKKKQIYSEQQISELKDFIQITKGIKLSKKTIEDKVIFRCKSFKQCGYSIEFKICYDLKSSKNPPHYSFLQCSRHHPVKNNDCCFFNKDQVIVASRKKYLNLIRPLIKEILVQSPLDSSEKNPTWLMKQLQIMKSESPEFIFKNLEGNYKRQVKKAFDNILLKTKNQINSGIKIQFSKRKTISKKKKIRKTPKDKVKKQTKKDELFLPDICQKLNEVKQEVVQIQMIEEPEVEEKSMNPYEKCFNEARMEEELFNEKNLKPKPESYVFQTPTKKKEKFGFDLENSGQKHRTTYNKSYEQGYLFDSVERIKPLKSDSESEEKS